MKKGQNNRNYGIDLLRCLSMIMVVILHLLGHGGVLGGSNIGTLRHMILNGTEALVYCAVDVFALISGYVMCTHKSESKKIAALWMQVLFYSIVLTGIVLVMYPELFSFKIIVKTVLPTLFSQYWYFTAYFGMFFFIPVLNYLIASKYIEKIIMTCIVIFSILPTMIIQDPFYTNYGLSMIWLSVCYLIGGYISVRDVQKKAGWCFKGYFACAAILFGSKSILEFVCLKVGVGTNYSYYLMQYTSPVVLLAAVLLVIGGSKLPVKETYVPVIKFASSGAFSAYLIHEHILIRDIFVNGKFVWLNQLPELAEIMILAAIAIFFFVGAVIFDAGRRGLFSLLRLNCLPEKIENTFLNSKSKIQQRYERYE